MVVTLDVVYLIQECGKIFGGNFVAVNGVGIEIDPVFWSLVFSVTIRSHDKESSWNQGHALRSYTGIG